MDTFSPNHNADQAFLNTFKAEGSVERSEFPSEKAGVAKVWNLPQGFDEHQLKHFLLERGEDLKLLEKMFEIIAKANPELAEVNINSNNKREDLYHTLYGVASRFNLSDIRFFVEEQGIYDVGSLKVFIILRDGYDKPLNFRPSPETLNSLFQSQVLTEEPGFSRCGKILDTFEAHGERLVDFQKAILSKDLFAGLWDVAPHTARQISSIREARPGDILRVKDALFTVTERPANGVINVISQDGAQTQLDQSALLKDIEAVTRFEFSRSPFFMKSYSAYPSTVLPHHYIKEEEQNIFKALLTLSGCDPLTCAKATTEFGKAFAEGYKTVDPCTQKPFIATNHVIEREFEGGKIIVFFLQKEGEQFKGPSSIETMPLIIRDRTDLPKERSDKGQAVLEAAILAPPESDAELLSLMEQIKDAGYSLRPDFSELLSVIDGKDNVYIHPLIKDESLEKTATAEIYRTLNALESSKTLSEQELQTLKGRFSEYIDLFTGETVIRKRDWGQEVGDPEYSASLKADFEVSTDITYSSCLTALSRMTHMDKSLERAAYPVTPDEFWSFANEVVFCRCSYEETYSLLSNLNPTGRENLRALFEAGFICISEDLFSKPGIGKMIDIFNSEKDLGKLRDFVSEQITTIDPFKSKECVSIRLSPLIDSRNKEGVYLDIGQNAWDRYQ